ncbi:hypothetical protein [Hymenobacter perfusus]|uniref:Uncharacterized protein n=1 Tax=Hymenobacter perfusus TaxID=1236770 RepID=A0A428KEA3_9BACT|nr:hypothetical protein [Hymenobacter perfusus]RSK44746.1 hypothetical protein EI293_09555 [Hymenobacter perfusus]
MKHFLLFTGLLLVSCQEAAKQPASAASAVKASSNPPKQYPIYTPDTAAILTNQNLTQLLAAVMRDSVVEHRKANAIPPVISAFLHQNDSLYNEPFAVADYGQRFNAGCTAEKGLPGRQLRYLGVGQSTCLLAYDVGGVGVFTRVLLFEFRHDSIVGYWTGILGNQSADKLGIVNQLLHSRDAPWRRYSGHRLML